MSDKEKLKVLLGRYAEISKEIANHPWMRNNNSPLGDLAERIVAEGLGGTVADNNAKGYDVELPDGRAKCFVSLMYLAGEYYTPSCRLPRSRLIPLNGFDSGKERCGKGNDARAQR